MVNKKVQRIKLIVAISVVVIVAILLCIRIIIYQKQGEKNMPFKLDKIIIISTAQKDEKTENGENQPAEASWSFNVVQNNDIYISIVNNDENNKNNKKIKNITLENIEILEAPQKGDLKAYMPNSLEGSRYIYTDDYEVSKSLTYRGADENDLKNLQINKNGGNLSISFANKNLGKYESGEETEVTYNGTMLSKLGVNDEEIKSKIAFDLIIELEDEKKYSGRVEIDLTCEGLIENGKTQIELTDFSNIIFKRI